MSVERQSHTTEPARKWSTCAVEGRLDVSRASTALSLHQELYLKNARVLSVAGRPVIVSRPNTKYYGHHALEMLLALAQARELGAAVYLLRSGKPVNSALFEIGADDVRLVPRSRRLDAVLGLQWRYADLRESWRLRRDRTRHALVDKMWRLCRACARRPHLPAPVCRWLRATCERLEARVSEAKARLANRKGLDRPPYFRRRLIREPLKVFLPDRLLARARADAARIGIESGARIVSAHSREPGFKSGQEMQDAKPGVRDDTPRNGLIENYLDAIDYLVRQGYTVVRLGDPTMRPLRRRGLIDLATLPERTALLELYCLMISEFVLCGESGPHSVSYLTNTPAVTVNVTDPISAYPIRPNRLFITKRVIDRESGHELTLPELLEFGYQRGLRNESRHQYVDNTPEDILAAVVEMQEVLKPGWQETPRQVRFREMVVQASEALRPRLNYARKWGADQGFLGDGCIADFYVSRYL